MLGTITADFNVISRSNVTARGTFERGGQALAFDMTMALPCPRFPKQTSGCR